MSQPQPPTDQYKPPPSHLQSPEFGEILTLIRLDREWVVRDESVCGAVRYLYNYRGDDAEVTKAMLVGLFTRQLDLLQQKDGWVAELLLSVPGLSADIVRALAAKAGT